VDWKDGGIKCIVKEQTTAGSCNSAKGTSNKMVGGLLQYFTGAAEQSDSQFGFCIPSLTVPGDLENIVTEKKVTVADKEVSEITPTFLAAYSQGLPGVTDQPSLVFSFPPPAASSYTWPQESPRRVAWSSFNMPKDAQGVATTLKLTLLDASGSEVSAVSMASLKNDNNEKVTIPATVPVGAGYSMKICADVSAQCWTSDNFVIKAKIENQEKPVEHEQLVPGNPDILVPGSEAYGVFTAGITLSTAETLGIQSHRLEVKELRGVEITGRRRSAGRRAAGTKAKDPQLPAL